MNKKIPIIIAAAAVITVSSALIVFKRKNKKILHLKSYDGRFVIEFPDEWKASKEQNELNENSNLEAVNNKKGICFIMFSKHKNELNNINLYEYNKTIFNSIKEENIISSRKININNKTMYATEFNSYYENMLIHYILYTLETENYFHQVMAALINNNLKIKIYILHFNTINNILSTLKEMYVFNEKKYFNNNISAFIGIYNKRRAKNIYIRQIKRK